MKRITENTWNKKFIDWLDNFLDNLVKKNEDGNEETETDMKQEPSSPISFRTSLIVVCALHAIAFYFMFGFDSKKANASDSEIFKQDKEFLANDTYVGVEEQPISPPVQVNNVAPPEVKSPTKVAIIYYTIERGDTMYSIARNNKISLSRLQKLNKIQDTNKIYVGQRLVLN